MIFATILSSCSNNGKKAETKDAEKVVVVKNKDTNKFTKIKNGSVVKWRASHLGGTDWNLKYHVKGSPGVPVNYLISDDIGFTIDVAISK